MGGGALILLKISDVEAIGSVGWQPRRVKPGGHCFGSPSRRLKRKFHIVTKGACIVPTANPAGKVAVLRPVRRLLRQIDRLRGQPVR
jgi:hypothetical protein